MAAQNLYHLQTPLAGGPAQRVFAITPHDVDELPLVTSGIYVGVEGDVTVVDRVSGEVVTFIAAPAGQIIPVCTSRVMAASTTATSLVGMA
jgi:hypothetical protein